MIFTSRFFRLNMVIHQNWETNTWPEELIHLVKRQRSLSWRGVGAKLEKTGELSKTNLGLGVSETLLVTEEGKLFSLPLITRKAKKENKKADKKRNKKRLFCHRGFRCSDFSDNCNFDLSCIFSFFFKFSCNIICQDC